MEINNVLEALNEALRSKDLDLYMNAEAIKNLKNENKELQAEIIQLKDTVADLKKKDW